MNYKLKIEAKAMPVGNIIFSNVIYFTCHYKYISVDYILAKNKQNSLRLSAENKIKGLSFHYKFSARKVKKIFKDLQKRAVPFDF